MNKIKKNIFLLKRSIYHHIFGICSKLGLPYSQLREHYYNYIMKQLLPTLEASYYESQSKSRASKTQNNHYVWVMWWQGVDKAPLVVKKNIERMKKIFGDQLKIISEKNISMYLKIDNSINEKFKNNIISPTHYADIIRVNLLKDYGGLWIDSTVVLSKQVLSFPKLFERPFVSICSKTNRNFNVSHEKWTTWFIGGKKDAQIFDFLSDFFHKYYNSFDFTLDYFLFDYAIQYFYKKDADFRKEIEAQKLNWNALYFYDNLYNSVKNIKLDLFNKELNYSVQKITYRIDKKKIKSDSLYTYIINNN